MTPTTWHILTGEYPPAHGGVSEYTAQVAHALATAGDSVHVWTRSGIDRARDGVIVHGLANGFSPGAFLRLDDALNNAPPATRVLVQYVPHAFGYKAMNLPLALWLAKRVDRPLDVMFHEVAYPIEPDDARRRRLLGAVNRMMARWIAHRADRIFVSTPAWEALLRTMVSRKKPVAWLPVPANVTNRVDHDRVRQIRASLAPGGEWLIGHFGTYGSLIGAMLRQIVPHVVSRAGRRFVLIGRGAHAFADELKLQNVVAHDDVAADDVGNHLAACDVLLQPYPDGASARRSSMMAGLAVGAAIVSNRGHTCDVDQWDDPRAIALAENATADAIAGEVEQLLANALRRTELTRRASVQYAKQFGLPTTIKSLRTVSVKIDVHKPLSMKEEKIIGSDPI